MNPTNAFWDNPVFRFFGKVVYLTKLQYLWLLCCLPVVTAGAATKALYAALYAQTAEEEWTAREFFGCVRKDFASVTLLWLGIAFFAGMLVLDNVILSRLDFPGRTAAFAVTAFAGILLLLFSGVVFPMLSRFSCSVKEAVINGLLLTMAHLPKAVLVAAMNLLPLVLLVILPQVMVLTGFVWVLCGFSLTAKWNASLLNRIFAQLEGEEK